ncbi:MAG TPA: LytTR family DNA-binding domain-containing protein [Gemmatimonadaceae bacterium]|nr:LytTR family DNA-binding domain-containing protein [Gemmatimonadaceae bacterium]
MATRALIVDDEPLARLRLRTLLADETDVTVVGECADGGRAIDEIEANRPDLVFLDVQMPELSGFDVIEAVGPSRMPLVVFVTAYDQYALEAFRVHALDYLLKPFEDERFRATMQRARERLKVARPGSDARVRALVDDMASARRYIQRLVIRSAGRVYFVRVDDIDWIEAADNYVRLHVGRTSHLLRQTLKDLEQQLDPERFMRIHRSTIVSLDRIQELQPWFHGEYIVILRDGTRLRTSRTFARKLVEVK